MTSELLTWIVWLIIVVAVCWTAADRKMDPESFFMLAFVIIVCGSCATCASIDARASVLEYEACMKYLAKTPQSVTFCPEN